ncbi:pilus assembly protein TadG-related protein [Brevundimonas sp.]|uniref:pilus assembly protein TadG-related protein n=1 Tax=Brevundimonas sp. TaxID=1871086 RepID=UPI0025EF9A7F|nr:pilus assembly protein TadG-related protein [Brevundimonas sp.]
MAGALRSLGENVRGNVAVIFALSLPLVVGGAGFGVETTYWYHMQAQLQAAADAAAHAGAMERRAGSGAEAVEQVAVMAASENGFDTLAGAAVVNAPPLTGPSAGGDAVEVILSQAAERFFTAMFSDGDVGLTARAVAVYRTAADACILALDPTASRAANFAGNTSVTLSGCSVMANSTAADAVNVQGSAQLTVDCLISGGGASLTAGATMTECRSAVTQAPPVADPFADLSEPTASGGCLNANNSSLSPGRYCSGMRLGGTVTLAPGVYYVSGGDFRVNSNTTVTGTGVTIFLSGGANVSINGNATVNLQAPTSGTYSGVLFFGNRSGSGSSTFNGTADSRMTGAVYMPGRAVDYLGNFAGLEGCTQIVARTVQWSGSTTVAADCTAYGMRSLPVLHLVQLTE